MEIKIKEVVANVLNIKAEELTKDSSPETIEQWDSLKQMNIIIALEDAFEIEFDDEEIGDMNSISLITLIISEKIGN